MPNKLGFSTDVERNYNTQKTRNVTEGDMLVIPTFNKKFTMNRNYDFKYDITKGLKFDFIATNEARILEPYGALNTQEKKDTVINNVLALGKTTAYNHQMNLNYAIPLNKLPLLDFTTTSAKYTGTYNWIRAPFNADSLGNTIQNSRVVQFTEQLNMITLYNKIPYFKKVNSGANRKKDKKDAKNNSSKPPTPVKGKDGKPVKDSTKTKETNPSIILEYAARVIMSLKNVNATYSMNNGTILPGYKQFTNMVGMDPNFGGPTPGFIAGDQTDIRQKAIDKDWLVKTPSLNTPYTSTSSTNLNIRANIEPIPDLKIEVTGVRTTTTNKSEFFRWKLNDTLDDGSIKDHYKSESQVQTGNFSMSFLSFGTSFKNGDATFANFLNSRSAI
jgi:cell surface protein SprA